MVLRIISGSLKGKHLKSFKGDEIRPTSDRVKEALFNIIDPTVIQNSVVLDLFAGTGNLGIEALSRGASRVCFVEKAKRSLNILRQNIELCNLADKSQIMPCEANRAISILGEKGLTFDLIFADPPYRKGFIDITVEKLSLSNISCEALIVAEYADGDAIKTTYNDLEMIDLRKYGDTLLSFFKRRNKD